VARRPTVAGVRGDASRSLAAAGDARHGDAARAGRDLDLAAARLTPTPTPAPTPIVVEATPKKAFAWAVDWPGWCRGAKTEDAAIQALAEYRDRYAPVAERAGIRFPARLADAFDVVERVVGNTTTEFGAPNVVADVERGPISAVQAKRQAALLASSWAVLDDVAAAAPAVLRKGPRGGGRDRDDIVRHVADAEPAYASKFGIRRRDLGDTPFRDAVLAAVRADRTGAVRPLVRRMIWHVLDHAWEIEDKSHP
jgi:hypothetical protein